MPPPHSLASRLVAKCNRSRKQIVSTHRRPGRQASWVCTPQQFQLLLCTNPMLQSFLLKIASKECTPLLNTPSSSYHPESIRKCTSYRGVQGTQRTEPPEFLPGLLARVKSSLGQSAYPWGTPIPSLSPGLSILPWNIPSFGSTCLQFKNQ